MISEHIILRIPAILLALTVHEYAHGWVAKFRGDTTAEEAGRLTFNPFSHIDPLGAVMFLFGPFGWAKPVPVNAGRMKDPRRDMIWVSLAGPGANIAAAFVFGYALRLALATGANVIAFPNLVQFVLISVMLNLGLAFFNLLPIPPLDGSTIAMGLIPVSRLKYYLHYVRHARTVLLVMIIADWIYADFGIGLPLFRLVMEPLWRPWYGFWKYLILGG